MTAMESWNTLMLMHGDDYNVMMILYISNLFHFIIFFLLIPFPFSPALQFISDWWCCHSFGINIIICLLQISAF